MSYVSLKFTLPRLGHWLLHWRWWWRSATQTGDTACSSPEEKTPFKLSETPNRVHKRAISPEQHKTKREVVLFIAASLYLPAACPTVLIESPPHSDGVDGGGAEQGEKQATKDKEGKGLQRAVAVAETHQKQSMYVQAVCDHHIRL